MDIDIKKEILDLSKDLDINNTINTYCPLCKGGTNKDKSFSITRTKEGILYICFRNKCNFKGFISDLNIKNDPIIVKEFEPRYFEEELEVIPSELMYELYIKYWMPPKDIRKQQWKYCRKENGLYIPLFDLNGINYGAQLKSLVKKPILRVSKVYTYRWLDRPMVHYPLTELMEEPLVLVEDAISAAKLSRFVHSAALLGTNLSAEQARSIRLRSPSILLALDADTWYGHEPKSLTIKRKWDCFFDYIDIAHIQRDVKDMNDEEFMEFVDEIRN